jgi:hypothetical protein
VLGISVHTSTMLLAHIVKPLRQSGLLPSETTRVSEAIARCSRTQALLRWNHLISLSDVKFCYRYIQSTNLVELSLTIKQYYNSAWIPILKAVANAMTAQDPYVFSAMEGGEVTANIKLDPKRQEPSALFFVLFGLVYETLANSSADATSTSSSRENAIASLQALKSLVEPQLSGKALLEPTVFEELTALWYRMAMTEPASVQIHLVEVAAAFAKSRAAQLREANAKDASGGSAKLSLDSPLTHCLRTCAYVLRQNIPSAKNHLVSEFFSVGSWKGMVH